MTVVEVLVALAILIGLAGIVVPVLPGTLLIFAAVLIWAVAENDAGGWTTMAVCTALLAVGTVVKLLIPGRTLKAAVPTSTLVVGALVGLVGFFVIPVVGLFIGFPLGVYVAERVRVGGQAAWPSTRTALKALGVSILIELVAGALASVAWLVGVVAG